MAIEQDIDASVPPLRTFNQLATPTQAQYNAIVKVIVPLLLRLLFTRANHPDDTP